MTELDKAVWNPEIVELAREFHKRYESEARRLGWADANRDEGAV